MIAPHDRQTFDSVVSALTAADPAFTRRMDRIGRPRRRLRAAAGVLLWTSAPICLLTGGWAGTVLAVAGAAYGTRLFRSRKGHAPTPTWSTARRRVP